MGLCPKPFFCSFFVRPKKEPKKGRQKCQLKPFFTLATHSQVGATKKASVHTISGFAPAPLPCKPIDNFNS
jgi:hypothetical protein